MTKNQLVGLLVMATALGVNAANFSPLVTNVPMGVEYLLHFIPVALLIVGAALALTGRRGGRVLISISIWQMWAFDVFAIIFAILNPSPSAFGPHTFNDYSPIVLFTLGAVIWLTRGRSVAIRESR